MNAAELAIPYREVLRYLGWKGQAVDARTQSNIERAMDECRALAAPRFVQRVFAAEAREDGIALCNAQLTLPGESMRKYLEGAPHAGLLAATLGAAIDRALVTSSASDVSHALLLDAACSVAVESVCDAAQAEIGAWAAEHGLVIKPRFSPGFGDLPLSAQGGILAALDAPRRIGVTATANNLLLPRKSVTAIVAIKTNKAGKFHETKRETTC